jgi:pullulanase/glycogen debranching enzyme
MTPADAASGSTPATEIWPGKAYPLGATYDGAGTNFAVFSEVAEHHHRGVPQVKESDEFLENPSVLRRSETLSRRCSRHSESGVVDGHTPEPMVQACDDVAIQK